MILGALVVLTLVGSLVLTAARLMHTALRWPILLASFSPYAVVGFLLVLVVCGLKVGSANSPWWVWPGLVLAAGGLVAQVWWLAPQFAGGDQAERSDLTVMTSNLSFGRADSVTVVRTVAAQEVDVLVLQEVTPTSLRALGEAGLPELLPYQRGTPEEGAAGTMVFSRYPLGQATVMPLGNIGLDVRVRAPQPFRLLAVHTAQPVRTPLPWLADMQMVQRFARAAIDQDPTLVVGDFNATRDHEAMRRVLDLGLRDAAEESGSGWQPTWPTHYRDRWLRPLIAIDHVLSTDDFEAVETRTVEVPHTDHLSVVARLRVRKAD
jgi:endonuclease/exonuclease/phosphatase (EEP) superfamily protein YafD